MCVPRKRPSMANISLTRNPIFDLSADIDDQLKEKVASFVTFSVAIDECAYIRDIAQLAIFIHGVDASLTVTDEFVHLVPMTGVTKGEDVFGHLLVYWAMLE